MNFTENVETPPSISEEEIEAHVMRVIMIEHFNVKKGNNLFGNRPNTGVMKDLQKIHDISTYFPMDASMLTYQ